MSFSCKIRCHEVAPRLDRRSVLAGIAGLIALAPVTSASTQDEVPLAGLVGSDGQASDAARSAIGRTVRVRGYLAPSLDGREFALSEASPGVCQLCGVVHDAGATIAVHSASVDGAPPIFEPVLVEGQLAIAGPAATVCVLDAKIHIL
jgi:hypothetical protein